MVTTSWLSVIRQGSLWVEGLVGLSLPAPGAKPARAGLHVAKMTLKMPCSK